MITDEERQAAVEAVEAASALCRSAQGRLLDGQTITKGDDSPVTVADFAAQALVCMVLNRRLGELTMVGEESAEDLRGTEQRALRDAVTELVGAHIDVTGAAEVLSAIDMGASDATAARFWTLDPIDGTKGFLRGDQFAIALALIDHGDVSLGVLGCPNLPNPDGSVGATFVTTPDGCKMITTAGDSTFVQVATPTSLAEARFCESVESGHTDQGQSVEIAALLGITAAPYRIDSQCKYAAVARGDASIYLRLPTRPGYREKIWDHAAGAAVVQQAGGRVTDVDGRTLDFTRGARLEANRGIVATDGRHHDEVVDAVLQVLGKVN